MRKSKCWLTTIYSVLLAAGLFCAQVCQVVCAAATCADKVQAAQPELPVEGAHCHGQAVAELPTESLPDAPSPTHDCQQHPALQLLPPDNQQAKVGLQEEWPAVADTLPSVVNFALAPDVTHLLPQTLFRPPPRSWLTTLQRI